MRSFDDSQQEKADGDLDSPKGYYSNNDCQLRILHGVDKLVLG